MNLDQRIEVVEFPQQENTYSVIQIDVGDQSYLVFGNSNRELHPEVLEKFLETKRLRVVKDRQRLGQWIEENIPLWKTDQYTVRGMGQAKVEKGGVTFSGKSGWYEIGVKSTLLPKSYQGVNFYCDSN